MRCVAQAGMEQTSTCVDELYAYGMYMCGQDLVHGCDDHAGPSHALQPSHLCGPEFAL